MIKNIIFDIGGVLVDWDPHIRFDSYFAGDTEKEEFFLKEICGREINVWMDKGMDPIDAMHKRIEMYPEWEAEITDYIQNWRLQIRGEIPGMDEYLSELKSQGFRLFGLTNWCAKTFDVVRKEFEPVKKLEGIVVSAEVGLLKPYPEIYLKLLETYGLKAEECVFVDDHAENTVGSEAVGIKGITFTSKKQLETDLKQITQNHV